MRRLPRGSLMLRSRGTSRARRILSGGLLSCALLAPPALGHHTPGHGASEGIRTLNAFAGRTPRAMQRALLLGEVVRTTAEPHLNAATIYTASAMVSLQPHPWFSAGLQAPLTHVNEDAPGVEPKSGYGDTRLELRLTPHADKLMHRVFTAGLNVSVPTRTVRFQVDPGPMWGLAPLAAFTRSYADWSWQAVLLAPIEHRPAGTAFEASGALLVSHRLLPPWTLALGAIADVRLASLCVSPRGDRSWCPEGRVTEQNRHNGSTRAYATAGSSVELSEDWTIALSVQAPLLKRRDFDVAGSIGLEARF
jgi:hypothetical protein